jgi:hypothetical protein
LPALQPVILIANVVEAGRVYFGPPWPCRGQNIQQSKERFNKGKHGLTYWVHIDANNNIVMLDSKYTYIYIYIYKDLTWVNVDAINNILMGFSNKTYK